MKIFNFDIFKSNCSRNEKFTAILCYLLWGWPFFQFILIGGSLRLPFFKDYPYLMAIIVICALVIVSLPYLRNKIRFTDVSFWIVYCLLYLMSMVFYPDNNQIQEEYAVKSMLCTVPYIFYGLLIDIEYMRKPMSRISLLVIIWYAFYLWFYKQQALGTMMEQGEREYMHYAYLLLPHVLMCTSVALKETDWLSICGAIGGLFVLLSFGNRGSLVCFAIYLLLCILFFVKGKRRAIIYGLSIIIFVLLYMYLDIIIVFFQKVLSDMGMSTRIFDFLLDGTYISYTSGRDELKERCADLIIHGPLFGYGFCGSWKYIGTYPHNLIYDLTMTFGLFPGVIILLVLVAVMIKAYRSAKNYNEKSFLLLLATVGFARMFLSYTFIDSKETFLLIGYCILLIRQSKKFCV